MTIGIAHHNPQTISLLVDRMLNVLCTLERDEQSFEKLTALLEKATPLKKIVLLCDTVDVVLRMKNKVKHSKLNECVLCIFDNPDELLKYQKIHIVDAVQEKDNWRFFTMTQQAFNQALLEAECGSNIDEIEYGKYTFSECLKQLLLAILDDGNYFAITTLLTAKYRRGLKAAEETELGKLIAKSELSQVGLAKLEQAAQAKSKYLDSLKVACQSVKDGVDLNQLAAKYSINIKDLLWVLSWKQFDTKKK